jgi:hypothetical protein
MTLKDFWKHLHSGGETRQGLTYRVLQNGKLHIKSPRAKNDKFYISKEKVDRYFNTLQGGMDRADFSYHHSAWFRRVYEYIVE